MDFPKILDIWDESSRWDCISMQQITNVMDGDGEDSGEKEMTTTIFRDQGRGRQTTILAPQRRGHFRVAVAVQKWPRMTTSTKTASLDGLSR